MDKTLVILIGIQGSGKSTFFASHLAGAFVRVNLDTIRSRQKEQELIDECIAEGKSYAIDNTNPTKADRLRYIPLAKGNGYRIVGYFLQSRIKDCIERNALREGKARVPDKAIAATSNRLERPSYAEGFDELYYVRHENGETLITPWKDFD